MPQTPSTARHALLLACSVLAFAACAAADDRLILVPLRLDYEFVRQTIVAQVYTGSDETAVLWDTGTGCGYLKLRNPTVSGAGSRIRIVSHGEARVGTALGSFCLAPVNWTGFLEVFEEPFIADDQQRLRFRVVESNLYDEKWEKGLLTGKIWDLVKDHAQPQFETVRIDLGAPVQDLREMLSLLLAHGDAARVETVLESLRLRAVAASESDLVATIGLTIPTAPSPLAAPSPEPTLTAPELAAWESAWQRWDAFLTFVVKQFATDAQGAELHQALAEVLLQARVDSLEALAPTVPGVSDPTPGLFLQTWSRLAPVVRKSAMSLPAGTAIRYLSFISAGDALTALSDAGPGLGLDISADGLRRLARIVAPQSLEDPVAYSNDLDPALRTLFGFGPPLPPPDITDVPPDSGWVRWLLPDPALAADSVPSARTLDRWVADRERLDAYLQSVREVLREATAKLLGTANLADQYREVYRRMVLATAWEESCWRQFVRTNGAVTFIKSPVGSSGMMQVNEKVWRGFYDLRGLRWDIHYNARAGAEILLHYLADYAIPRGEHSQPGGVDNLARATYSAYNGGPGALTRYRQKTTRRDLKRIDALFWEKYNAVTQGRELEVARCLGGD